MFKLLLAAAMAMTLFAAPTEAGCGWKTASPQLDSNDCQTSLWFGSCDSAFTENSDCWTKDGAPASFCCATDSGDCCDLSTGGIVLIVFIVLGSLIGIAACAYCCCCRNGGGCCCQRRGTV